MSGNKAKEDLVKNGENIELKTSEKQRGKETNSVENKSACLKGMSI